MHIADTLHMRYSRKGDIKSNILATRASEKCRDILRAACRIDGVSLDKSPALVEGNSVGWSRSSMPLGLSACKEEFNVRFETFTREKIVLLSCVMSVDLSATWCNT